MYPKACIDDNFELYRAMWKVIRYASLVQVSSLDAYVCSLHEAIREVRKIAN